MSYPNAQLLLKRTLTALTVTTLTLHTAAYAQVEAQNTPATIKTATTEGYVTSERAGTESISRTQPVHRNPFFPPEIWVADINTHLFDDLDHDGYYTGFTLSMDVDVEWDWADVFAEIYLQSSGTEPRLLHITQVFTIYENATSDLYQVDVGLLDRVPSGDYDLFIDIVNASTGQVVDSVSNQTHFNLENLPLQSSEYQYAGPSFQTELSYEDDYSVDYEAEHEIDYVTNYDAQFSVETGNQNGVSLGYELSALTVGHGGAAGWFGLLGLLLAARVRQRRGTNISI